jgi:hypothetical protein
MLQPEPDMKRQLKPVSLAALAGVGVFVGYIVLARLLSQEPWVPVLDSANLAVHEAGHALVGIFSDRLEVYGGTVFQLLFPGAAFVHFLRRGEIASSAATLIWFGESLLNVARYMADAQSQLLPLVGGGQHDWTEIFLRWGVLSADAHIARFTAFVGGGLIAGTLVWVSRAWWFGRHVA